MLYVNHTARLGGAERSLLELMQAMKGKIRPALYVFEEGPLCAAARAVGLEVHVYPHPQQVTDFSRQAALRAPWLLLGLVPQLLGILRDLIRVSRDWKADLLHANSVKAPLFALAAGGWIKKPVVSHVRDLFPARFPFTFMLGLMARFSRVVFANSRAVAGQFPETLLRTGRVRVALNGVDPMKLQALSLQEAPGDLRAELGVQPGEALLLCVGRLQFWKGQDTAVAALPLITHPARLVLVGKGLDQEDTGPALSGQARELGVVSRVVRAGEREDVPALMRAADVVLHTSREPEPFGRVVLEALMLRRPVIATDLGGPREIITHQVHGLLIPPADAGALAAAVDWLLSHPSQAEVMARQGYEHAVAHFSLDRLAGEILNAYEDI